MHKHIFTKIMHTNKHTAAESDLHTKMCVLVNAMNWRSQIFLQGGDNISSENNEAMYGTQVSKLS